MKSMDWMARTGRALQNVCCLFFLLSFSPLVPPSLFFFPSVPPWQPRLHSQLSCLTLSPLFLVLEQMRARHASLERKLDGQRRVQHHHHHHHHGYTHSKRASFGAGVGIPGASGASAGVGMVYATSLPARRLSPGSFR